MIRRLLSVLSPHHQLRRTPHHQYREFAKVLNDNSRLSAEFEEIYAELQSTFQSVLERVWSALAQSQKREEINSQSIAIVREWKNLAFVLDRFLLYVFVVVTTLCTIFLLFQPQFLKK